MIHIRAWWYDVVRRRTQCERPFTNPRHVTLIIFKEEADANWQRSLVIKKFICLFNRSK